MYSVIYGGRFISFGQSTEPDCLIKMDVDKIGSSIQSTMYGVFFEDINFGADGGLYAEILPMQDYPPPRKQLTGTSLMNERFKGIGIKVNDKYDFLFYARTLKDGTK